MERIKGRILDGDNIILDDVEVSLNMTEDRAGRGMWNGSFTVPSGPSSLGLKGTYRLVLEDGRSGDIELAGGQLAVSRMVFTGSGPLS